MCTNHYYPILIPSQLIRDLVPVALKESHSNINKLLPKKKTKYCYDSKDATSKDQANGASCSEGATDICYSSADMLDQGACSADMCDNDPCDDFYLPFTPLQQAAYHGNRDVIKAVLSANVLAIDPKIKVAEQGWEFSNMTAAQIAQQRGHLRSAKLIEDFSKSIMISNKKSQNQRINRHRKRNHDDVALGYNGSGNDNHKMQLDNSDEEEEEDTQSVLPDSPHSSPASSRCSSPAPSEISEMISTPFNFNFNSSGMSGMEEEGEEIQIQMQKQQKQQKKKNNTRGQSLFVDTSASTIANANVNDLVRGASERLHVTYADMNSPTSTREGSRSVRTCSNENLDQDENEIGTCSVVDSGTGVRAAGAGVVVSDVASDEALIAATSHVANVKKSRLRSGSGIHVDMQLEHMAARAAFRAAAVTGLGLGGLGGLGGLPGSGLPLLGGLGRESVCSGSVTSDLMRVGSPPPLDFDGISSSINISSSVTSSSTNTSYAASGFSGSSGQSDSSLNLNLNMNMTPVCINAVTAITAVTAAALSSSSAGGSANTANTTHNHMNRTRSDSCSSQESHNNTDSTSSASAAEIMNGLSNDYNEAFVSDSLKSLKQLPVAGSCDSNGNGVPSHHTISPSFGIGSHSGYLKPTEDRVSVHKIGVDMILYSVYDGHGGRHYAEAVSKQLPILVKQRIESRLFGEGVIVDDTSTSTSSSSSGSEPMLQPQGHAQALTHALTSPEELGDIMRTCMQDIDAKMVEHSRRNFLLKRGGCTATLALVTKTDVIVANVGDSPSVLFDAHTASLLRETTNHSPENEDEFVRASGVGGSFIVGRQSGERRLVSRNGNLGLTRAFGQVEFKLGVEEEQQIVNCQATVDVWNIRQVLAECSQPRTNHMRVDVIDKNKSDNIEVDTDLEDNTGGRLYLALYSDSFTEALTDHPAGTIDSTGRPTQIISNSLSNEDVMVFFSDKLQKCEYDVQRSADYLAEQQVNKFLFNGLYHGDNTSLVLVDLSKHGLELD